MCVICVMNWIIHIKTAHTMNLMEFNHRFPDEHSAMMAIKDLREKQGVTCRKCGLDAHYCKKLSNRFSVKSAELVKD